MRVQFQVSGGIGHFPGLAAARTIDADALSEEDRRALQELVEEARFFELPAHAPAPRGAADYQTYAITIEEGGQSTPRCSRIRCRRPSRRSSIACAR